MINYVIEVCLSYMSYIYNVESVFSPYMFIVAKLTTSVKCFTKIHHKSFMFCNMSSMRHHIVPKQL